MTMAGSIWTRCVSNDRAESVRGNSFAAIEQMAASPPLACLTTRSGSEPDWLFQRSTYFAKLARGFFLLRFAVFLQAADFQSQLFFQRFDFVEFPRRRCALAISPLKEKFFLGDARFELGIDFGELLLLIVGQGESRLIFRQSLHRQLVGRFHSDNCSLALAAASACLFVSAFVNKRLYNCPAGCVCQTSILQLSA